ncbi:MAG: hypothetical protein LBJ59_07155 [Zoogloeaceae bacterium]|jgi:hypothetical protein|nr:hypothetical protein [Zoogloeaceae bacterium]
MNVEILTKDEILNDGIEFDGRNLYCKMFIDIRCAREELIDIIVKLTDGEKELFRTINAYFGEIDVNENSGFYANEARDDSFLYYKFYLDIAPKPQIGATEYISNVKKIMKYFISQNINVAAACDFEDELTGV